MRQDECKYKPTRTVSDYFSLLHAVAETIRNSRSRQVLSVPFFPAPSAAQSEYKAMVELHNKYSGYGFGMPPPPPNSFCACALLLPLLWPAAQFHPSYSYIVPFADILAFPCNQFGYQESSCDVDIKAFAKAKGAMFTMMSKIDVVRTCALDAYNVHRARKERGEWGKGRRGAWAGGER